KSLQLRLKGKDGNIMRVVLWNKDESTIPKVVTSGAKTRLIGVKTKVGQMGLELHGDEGTVLEIEGATEIQPIIIRILSMAKSDSGNTLILGTTQDKKLVSITDTALVTKDLLLGDVIECMPSKVYGKSIMLESDSFVRKIDDNSLPTLQEIRTKIKEIKPAETPYCIEAIILKSPEKREIQTKTGETVLLSETYIEDDTGQIWLKGWRSQARLLEQFTQGEIISVTAVNAKAGLEGRTELFLSAYSVITRKN
ncbi:MAG: single-stranded DNA-binding protein, partial [Nitrosotalea sp.]